MDVCKIGKGKGGKRQGPPRVGSYPHVRNLEKYPDCITDLICWGGNTDVCPWWQTPSGRHWQSLTYLKIVSVLNTELKGDRHGLGVEPPAKCRFPPF